MGSKYLCMECYSIYDSDLINKERRICPDPRCYGDLAEIDELMIPIIALLNMKGYITKYCCSGHCYIDPPQTYIMFYNGVQLPNLPKGFTAHTDRHHGNSIEFPYPRNLSRYDAFCLMLDNAKILLKWAMDLPEVDDWFDEDEDEDYRFITDESVEIIDDTNGRYIHQ